MLSYTFEATVHLWEANQAVHFVSVPQEMSDEIRDITGGLTNGFGSLKVRAMIGATIWNTSIFPASKTGTFELPIKAEVRKKNTLTEGATAEVHIEILGF